MKNKNKMTTFVVIFELQKQTQKTQIAENLLLDFWGLP